MAKKFKTWNNSSFTVGAPTARGATPKAGSSYATKWFVCSRTPSRALELILKTALPHYYLESEQQGQNFSVNSWTEVLQDYWSNIGKGKCPRIKDIPGFKTDLNFSQGFSLTFPNATKRHFKNSETGSGAIVNYSIPPNVSGYVNPSTVDVEVIPGSWNGKYYEYNDTIQLSPSWTYHAARQTAPVPDYCLPEPGTNLFNDVHVSKPALYSDNGTGYPSVGWKGNSNASMHEHLIKPQFQSVSFPSNLYTFLGSTPYAGGTAFGADTWKASLHAQTYYTGQGSYRYEANANNPALFRQFDALSGETNATLVVDTNGGLQGGVMIKHTAQSFEQALIPTNLTDTCSNQPIFNHSNIVQSAQSAAGNLQAADAYLRAFGKDAFNMGYNTIDGNENDALFSIDGFHDGIFEVTVPIWWNDGSSVPFINNQNLTINAQSSNPLYGFKSGNTLAGVGANINALVATTNPNNVLFVESTIFGYNDGGPWGNCGYPFGSTLFDNNTTRLFTVNPQPMGTFMQGGVFNPMDEDFLFVADSATVNKAKLDDLENTSWFPTHTACKNLTPCRKCTVNSLGGDRLVTKHKYIS